MNKNTDSRPGGKNGYTLVEVLIALTLFAVGMLAVASMQITGIRGNATAKWLTQGSTYSADRIEQLITRPFSDADLTNGSHGPITEGIYTISWDVIDDQLIKNIKTIEVTVDWVDNGMAKTTTFTHYKADL